MQLQWYFHSIHKIPRTYPLCLLLCLTLHCPSGYEGWYLQAMDRELQHKSASPSSLGGMGCCFSLLKPGPVVEINITFSKSICALLFFPCSVIPCYTFICELSICYILILCSVIFPLELVIASCWGCFLLIAYLYLLSNNWPVLSYGFADVILCLCFKTPAKEGGFRSKESCLYTWYKVL